MLSGNLRVRSTFSLSTCFLFQKILFSPCSVFFLCKSRVEYNMWFNVASNGEVLHMTFMWTPSKGVVANEAHAGCGQALF